MLARGQSDTNAFVSGLRERLGEPKGKRSRTVALVVLEAFAALGDGGKVSCGDPPEAVDGLVHFFKPLSAVAQDARMIGLVDVVAQGCQRFPDRHIEKDAGITRVVDDVCGVAGCGLQAPDEARCFVSQSVDGIELGNEFGDLGIVDGGQQAADVDLREMVVGHGADKDAAGAAKLHQRISVKAPPS